MQEQHMERRDYEGWWECGSGECNEHPLPARFQDESPAALTEDAMRKRLEAKS